MRPSPTLHPRDAFEAAEEEALASSEPCPEPCGWLHRLRYPYNLEGLTAPDEAFEEDENLENLGTDCRLCGQFVHMDTWHLYYVKWRREQGLPELESD